MQTEEEPLGATIEEHADFSTTRISNFSDEHTRNQIDFCLVACHPSFARTYLMSSVTGDEEY